MPVQADKAFQPAIPVLLTVRELNHGGIERDVAKIAIHLDRRRFVPHVASFSNSGRRYDELTEAGVPVLHFPVTSMKSVQSLKQAMRLRAWIRAAGIRVVHSWDASAAFFSPVARFCGVPAVITSQLGSRDLLDNATRKLLRWTDRMSHRVVVNCKAMREHLVRDEGVPAAKIDLCYNGYDTTEFRPPVHPKPDRGEAPVIGAICVLRKEKALDLLQEAFALVLRRFPGVRLKIAGNGPEKEALVANSARLGIGDACEFLPGTSDVAGFLRDLDIFVLCSRSEAFSNALLESLACGCAAVGSRVGGTPEQIGNDERGLLFESGSVSGLAEVLERLISSPALRSELSRSAAEFAPRMFSIERAANVLSGIYDRALGHGPAPGASASEVVS